MLRPPPTSAFARSMTFVPSLNGPAQAERRAGRRRVRRPRHSRGLRQRRPAQILKVPGDPKGAEELLGGNKAAAMFETGYREIVSCPAL